MKNKKRYKLSWLECNFKKPFADRESHGVEWFDDREEAKIRLDSMLSANTDRWGRLQLQDTAAPQVIG